MVKRIEKLITIASKAQIRPVKSPSVMVLKEPTRNLLLKISTFVSNAQRLSSMMGRIKPIKIGMKQNEDANTDLSPLRPITDAVLNVELSLV